MLKTVLAMLRRAAGSLSEEASRGDAEAQRGKSYTETSMGTQHVAERASNAAGGVRPRAGQAGASCSRHDGRCQC